MSALGQVVVPCGGQGQRLAPITNDLPKVLVPIGGRPLLKRVFELSKSKTHWEYG